MESSKEGFVIRVVLLQQVKNPFYHYNIFYYFRLAFWKKKSDKEEEFRVCVIEKAANVGRHILSGSRHEPLALNKLILVSFS